MSTNDKQLRNYVMEHAKEMLKEPRSFIRYPFIDPGSVYEGNLWDWDSYWSVYGLLNLMDSFDEELREKILIHAKGNVFNFLDHQMEDGYIPMMIEVSLWSEPYLIMRHREGVRMNMHKPFLCTQICLISDYIGDYSWIEEYKEQLHLYFSCYKKEYYHEKSGLYIWANDIMIGVDNDPATFGKADDTTANIYLNSFMVSEISSMEKILSKLGEGAKEISRYETERTNLEAAIQKECWDERDGFFYTVDVDIKTRSYDWFHQGLGVFWNTIPIRIRCWSGLIPMYMGLADEDQAKKLVSQLTDEAIFGSPYGVTTLARNEKMYSLEASNNPSNWLGPIWLVANYIVFHGLLRYGYVKEANAICEGTLKMLTSDLEKTGQLHEFYHPDSGEPIMNGGFLNWNLLALNMVDECKKYKEIEK